MSQLLHVWIKRVYIQYFFTDFICWWKYLTLLHLYTVYVIFVLFTGEAGVPFFHSCGSDFDELYVGTGAAKVKKLFGKKYKNYMKSYR